MSQIVAVDPYALEDLARRLRGIVEELCSVVPADPDLDSFVSAEVEHALADAIFAWRRRRHELDRDLSRAVAHLTAAAIEFENWDKSAAGALGQSGGS